MLKVRFVGRSDAQDHSIHGGSLQLQEVSFKQHLEDFRTMAPGWWVTVNGGKKFTLTDVLEQGSYNALIGDQAFFCSSKLGRWTSSCSVTHAHH